MTLKALVERKIMTEIIKGTAPENIEESSRSIRSLAYRVLVVDNLSMRIISSCCQMHNIALERIALVENINKKREPLPSLDAIYFITPTSKSIAALVQDFDVLTRTMYRGTVYQGTMYRNAHVFLTDTCPEELFDEICKTPFARRIKTFKEMNIAFVPYESQVFSLDSPISFQYYYNSNMSAGRVSVMERIAQQISTICVTLGEYPSVRYRGDFERNVELAQMVQQKLDAYKADDPTMGEGREKSRSQLLILDRGFDCVSPLLHELTFQAMAYDLLKIENDVYRYEGGQGPLSSEKEVLLDENDDLWVELRHQHIAVVSQIVASNMKEFTDSKRMPSDKASMKDLSQMIKKMPQYQKELRKYSKHLQLVEDCINQDHVELLCSVEQDLAMGTDTNGEKIKDQMRRIVPILLDTSSPGITEFEKLRIILLYILAKNGVTQENLSKLVQHANIQQDLQPIITNLKHLGCNVLIDMNNKKKTQHFPRKDRTGQHKYDTSRWTPIVKDIMEDAIDEKLDQKHFPFWAGRVATPSLFPANATSARKWLHEKGKENTKKLPRIIIFIVGGVSFSEIRSAYEVTHSSKTWEVIIGSTHILVPEGFLADLQSL